MYDMVPPDYICCFSVDNLSYEAVKDYTVSPVVLNPTITFNQAYPSWLEFPFDGYQVNPFDGQEYYFKYQNEIVLLGKSQATLTNTSGVASGIPELVGAPVFAFYIVKLDNDTFTRSFINETIGYCYYCSNITGYNSNHLWYRLQQSDINPNWIIVGETITDIDTSSSISFLVSLGQNLISVSSAMFDFITFEIAGQPFIYWIFGAGFIVFAGWVIGKSIVPK